MLYEEPQNFFARGQHPACKDYDIEVTPLPTNTLLQNAPNFTAEGVSSSAQLTKV